MPNLLLDLDIDAACWEFLAQRIVAHGGTQGPQPIVAALDAAPDDEMPDDWDELTAEAARIGSGPETVMEMAERMLGRMGD
jgi:hypothetical protein